MEYLIDIIQFICTAFFLVAVLTLFFGGCDSFQEFIAFLCFIFLFSLFSYIPYSFKPYSLKSSELVRSEVLEDNGVFKIMVNREKIYPIKGYAEVIKIKDGRFNTYKQIWEKKYGAPNIRNVTRVFDFEGNLIIDLY